jgi:LAGLIDADG DNA endonuclease family protein
MGRALGGNVAIEERLRAAQGLSAFDCHALAGFVDAEGSFGLHTNNGGRSWACAMALAVRLDDGDLVSDLCRSTGLGHLFALRPRRGSRPQACWRVSSKRECLELARLLKRFPLRARKRRDFEIWTRAVERWAATAYDARAGPSFHADMRRDADELRAVRRYVESPPPALDGPPQDLLAYFGGFFSGDGSFGLSGLAPRAVIRVRQDDRSILDFFAARLGLGAVRDQRAYDNPNPSATWMICATDEFAPAVELFDAAELRGRKRREFEVWREAAHERAFAKIGGRRWDRARVRAVAERLTALRVYRRPSDFSGATTVAERQHAARRAYLHVLRTFAAQEPGGKLTAAAYARARERHPEWPTRNTIAAGFGGWALALEAAGFGSRVSGRARARA